jgi:phospholipid/cholesterol/gamma-HCH transport system substrate-binding protein
MKMSVEARARVAFAFALVLGVAATLAWYFVAASRYATFEIRTHDPVSGLIADAPVEFHGVEVGKVKRVELTDARSVSVVLSVDKSAPVTTATIATITGRGLATRGFTGYVYVSLENVGADARPLAAAPGQPFPLIATAPSRSVNLDTAISRLNENVQTMTDLLQAVLDQKTVASLKESVDSLQRLAQTLAANSERLNAMLSNGERASTRLVPLLQASDAALREAHRALAGFDDLASKRFPPLVQSSNDAVRAIQTQLLPEAYRTLATLDQLSASLADVTAQIKRDPSVLIRGTAPAPGPGEAR